MGEPEKLQPTHDTIYRIKQWIGASSHVASVKRQLGVAEADLSTTTNELGAFLSPTDAKAGEVFNIWYGDGLLAITKLDESGSIGKFQVTWRKRPRELP